jgi:membrane fusion protein (multidrug efflux system)
MTVILLLSISCGKSEQPKPRLPEVEVVQVEQKGYSDLEEVGRHTGRIGQCPDQAAYDRLSTTPDLQGRLVCKKRKLLFEIDPRTFQAALDQTKGQLANRFKGEAQEYLAAKVPRSLRKRV